MWKVIAVIIAVTLVIAPARSMAADKPAPDARLKQMEELGAIRGRVTFKYEELRRLVVQTTDGLRYTGLGAAFTKTRASIQAKITAENAKATKDQAALDAYALKVQTMDEMWNRTLATAWNKYSTRHNEQYQFVWNYFSTLIQLCNYDDYWNRADLDLQILANASAAVEARLDLMKSQIEESSAAVNKAMDEAEPVFKE